MPRYRLLVEYDGRPYRGYQIQDNLPSVQGSIERAILGFSGQQVRLVTAGRTDTGVHATAQVVHMDLDQDWRPEVVRDAINAYLIPEPISILKAEIAADDFSARFSAKGRRYLYRILNRRSPPALDQGRVWHMKRPLNVEAMHEAAQVLVGVHDFTTFRDLQCQAKSPVKSIDVARVWRLGDEVHLAFEARSFLHRQVRSMTGSIAQVGIGRWSKEHLAKILEAKDRQACGVVAPPDGLYLVGVEY
jgi:tRNA pseudouridine38-40 synthase